MALMTCGNGTGANEFPVGEIVVGESALTVWVADESQERRQGLRGVEELSRGLDGMLFVFPGASPLSFTMKDTLIPLDIWWFDAEATLIGRTAMVPCGGEPCVSYRSPGDARWALETPAGEMRFETGARLSIVEKG
jgi:uncharacterized membrane protein (UPF0127 family)